MVWDRIYSLRTFYASIVFDIGGLRKNYGSFVGLQQSVSYLKPSETWFLRSRPSGRGGHSTMLTLG